jgi:hypothetical protein
MPLAPVTRAVAESRCLSFRPEGVAWHIPRATAGHPKWLCHLGKISAALRQMRYLDCAALRYPETCPLVSRMQGPV